MSTPAAESSARASFEPESFEPESFAPDSFAPDSLAPDSFAPNTAAPPRSQDVQSVPPMARSLPPVAPATSTGLLGLARFVMQASREEWQSPQAMAVRARFARQPLLFMMAVAAAFVLIISVASAAGDELNASAQTAVSQAGNNAHDAVVANLSARAAPPPCTPVAKK